MNQRYIYIGIVDANSSRVKTAALSFVMHLYSFQLTKLEMVGTHVLTLMDSNWEHLQVIKIFHAPLHRINEIQQNIPT